MKRKAAFVIALFSLIALALLAQKQNASHPVPKDESAPAFRRTYEPNRVIGTSGGGHASAPGSRPAQRSSKDDVNELNLTGDAVRFEEIPLTTAKTFFGGGSKDHILESAGAGVALLDYDGDGRLDVFIVNGAGLTPDKQVIRHRHLLYRNLGGWKFQDVSKQAGVDTASWGAGVCAGDYDGDGLLDIYVTNFGPNLLFRNNGNGTFSEVARTAGVAVGGWSTGCSFFDADADGKLDLYVARYVTAERRDVIAARRTLLWRGGPRVMAGPTGLPGASDVLFHNEGNGHFRDNTSALGLKTRDASYGFGVLATDYNGDGWVDLFIANDTNANYLFRNRGNGTFDEVALASGVAFSADGRAQAGMGVDAGDADGDGLLDLIVTNFAQDTNTLYRNADSGFEDVSEAAGLKARTFDRLGWGVAFLDADLDGLVDLFFANGHIYPQVDQFPQLNESYRQQNQLLLNRGGRFIDVSSAAGSGLQSAKSHRGLAIGDLDNDGKLDVVITSMDDMPTLLRNCSTFGNHWVSLQLRDDGPNAFCIGATVIIDAGGKKQTREVRSGGSYVSQNDLRAHFGLGSYSGKIDVTVRMPGGGLRQWYGIDIDRYVKIRMSDGEHTTRR
jgi:enediyne biosynthesis protein E4